MDKKEFKLKRPVEFGGQVIDTLTVKNDVTVDDVEEGFDEVDAIRASKKRPLLDKKDLVQTEWMKIMVGRATGHPVECMGLLSYQDLNGAYIQFSDFLL